MYCKKHCITVYKTVIPCFIVINIYYLANSLSRIYVNIIFLLKYKNLKNNYKIINATKINTHI